MAATGLFVGVLILLVGRHSGHFCRSAEINKPCFCPTTIKEKVPWFTNAAAAHICDSFAQRALAAARP